MFCQLSYLQIIFFFFTFAKHIKKIYLKVLLTCNSKKGNLKKVLFKLVVGLLQRGHRPLRQDIAYFQTWDSRYPHGKEFQYLLFEPFRRQKRHYRFFSLFEHLYSLNPWKLTSSKQDIETVRFICILTISPIITYCAIS